MFIFGCQRCWDRGTYSTHSKRDGKERVIEEINEWTLQLKSILTILGARTISDLQTCSIVITKDVREWCELRGIDVMRFAHRSL